MLNFYMPVKVYSGESCIFAHKNEIGAFGKRALIVTGRTSAKKCGALSDVTAVFEELGISFEIFDEIGENPLLSLCADAGKKAAAFGAEFIFGIGGGSPMDAAKAIAVFAANPTLSEADFYDKKWAEKPLPILLLGTTAGTGSEVTEVSVLTDSKGRKHSIHDPYLYAKISFGDPKYTLSMPLPVTLSTGIDVLMHSAESYFSKKANEISKAASLHSIRLLYAPLLKAAAFGEMTTEDRETLYEASVLGGIAISYAGTCFPHNMGYYLTENYGIAHGNACAVFLPDFLFWVRENAPETAAEFYEGLGLSERELIALTEKCLPEMNISMTEAEIEKALPRWENNNSVKNTAGNMTVKDVEKVLREKFLK